MEAKRYADLNQRLKKEQILFFLILSLSVWTLYQSYRKSYPQNIMVAPLAKNNGKQYFQAQPRNIFVEESFYSYWAGSQRDPFRRVYDRNRLPPLVLELPSLERFAGIIIPPLPAPSRIHWRSFPEKPFSPILVEGEIEVWKKAQTTSIEKGKLAQTLEKQVREQDYVQMTNSRSYQGKIIRETPQEVIISVQKGKEYSNYTLPMERISKIEHIISLEEICLQERKKASTQNIEKRITLAQAFGELNFPEMAIALFEECLKNNPKSLDIYLSLAQYYLSQLEYEKAYRVYLQAENRGLGQEDLWYPQARLQNQLGLLHLAQKTLRKCVDRTSWALRLQIEFELGQFSEMKKYLEQLANIYPNFPDFEYWRARLALQENQLEQCLLSCDKASQKKEFLPEIQNLKGVVFYLQGDLENAQAELKNAYEQGSSNAFFNLALVYAAGGALSRAQELLKQIVENKLYHPQSGQILATLAYITYQNNPSDNLETVQKLLQKSLQIDKNNLLAHYWQGEILRSGEDSNISQAYQAYRKALDVDFTFLQSLLRLAIVSSESRNYPDAIRYFQEALKRKDYLSPSEQAYIYSSLAWNFISQNNFTKVEEHLQKALKTDSKSVFTHKLLAYIFQQSGEHTRAISHLDKILIFAPEDIYTQKIRAKILENSQRVFWNDSFSRANGDQILRGWQEEEGFGVLLKLQNKKVLFTGQQVQAQPTQLSRTIEGKNFVRFSGEIENVYSVLLAQGIFISQANGKKGFYFGKNTEKKWAYAIATEEKWEWQELSSEEAALIKEGKNSYSLGIELGENNHIFLQVDGQEIAQLDKIRLSLDQAKKLKVGFFGLAPLGTLWQMTVDNARVIEKEKSSSR